MEWSARGTATAAADSTAPAGGICLAAFQFAMRWGMVYAHTVFVTMPLRGARKISDKPELAVLTRWNTCDAEHGVRKDTSRTHAYTRSTSDGEKTRDHERSEQSRRCACARRRANVLKLCSFVCCGGFFTKALRNSSPSGDGSRVQRVNYSSEAVLCVGRK